MRSQWDPYLKYLNFKFCQKSVKHSDHVLFAKEFILLGEKKKGRNSTLERWDLTWEAVLTQVIMIIFNEYFLVTKVSVKLIGTG